MKFCNLCQSVMKKTTKTGSVVFVCVCTNKIQGSDDDTLITENILDVSETIYKHKTTIDNSPFDKATYRIERTCPKCNLKYMNLVRIGEMNTVIITCECGYQTTNVGESANSIIL